MIDDAHSWLSFAGRLRTEWGGWFFVCISYTFVCLFAISQVRAFRLDRQYSKRRRLSRMESRAIGFFIGSPIEFVLAYLWGLPYDIALMHAVLAGLAVPVVAEIWIWLLYWRGLREQAEIFKISAKRRDSDPCSGDSTDEYTRL